VVNVKRGFLRTAVSAAAVAFFGLSAGSALAAPIWSGPPPQIVRLSVAWFSTGAPPVAYRFGIYAAGADRSAVIVFDRDMPVPIENAASIDTGDDNAALPAGQHYLRVTLPAKFRDRIGKVAVQVSQDGRLSDVTYVHVESAPGPS
jgi:hypothetical protein